MDRNTVIGFILIGIVLMIWMWMNAPEPQRRTTMIDSVDAVHKLTTDSVKKFTPPAEQMTAQQDSLGRYFKHLKGEKEKVLVIKTQLYRAEISTQGGGIRSWELKQYKTWDKHPVNFMYGAQIPECNLLFSTSDGKLINTRYLTFEANYQDHTVVSLAKQDSFQVMLVLPVSKKSRIVKTLIFYGDVYSFDAVYRFENMENIIANFEYQVTWEYGPQYFEHNSIDESNYAKAGAYAGGELTEIDATNINEVIKQNISGRITWVASRNKYFATAMIPRHKESQGAYLEGTRMPQPDHGMKEYYTLGLKMPFSGRPLETDRFTVFLGPLDFDIVKSYDVDLDQIMSLGAAWIIRPISEYVIIPLFKFLKIFIPNYGFVLIVFSMIVKIALYPLTKSSMKSMQKMQALQPMMTEIREKYKDDPQKMNQQVMRLYKEYGVNPAGGCLPLLLQLPILYALWSVFSSTIELRQAAFIWWINDLSIPDVITTLPFRLPLFGIDKISGLALLMGITMFIQQKMSVKDPRQKAMVWLMPILLTLLFNGFPSGLNLYYFVFNLLSIGQQAWMNKHAKNEPLKKVEPKKATGGFISRISKNLPKTPR
ncbi:MAG: membrane protein insertase YidC [Ignavibacteriae bacterium]|nr:membrane protein insertase YidC [Ignavibacteriota bacterium]